MLGITIDGAPATGADILLMAVLALGLGAICAFAIVKALAAGLTSVHNRTEAQEYAGEPQFSESTEVYTGQRTERIRKSSSKKD
ncbi:MAG: hypothetical protein K6A65_07805 [Succinivibrionaceae bacterium]|nr:hypothetical protein [Succinivibrionaceae bacterium]